MEFSIIPDSGDVGVVFDEVHSGIAAIIEEQKDMLEPDCQVVVYEAFYNMLTYYGTIAPLSDKIVDMNVDAQKVDLKYALVDLDKEPSVVLAGKITQTQTPEEFNINKEAIKLVSEVHVAYTDLANPGEFVHVRNVANGKIARALVVGAMPTKSPSDKTSILLSPLTQATLDLREGTSVVQVEKEEILLPSTIHPPKAAIVEDLEVAYLKRGDSLKLKNLELDDYTWDSQSVE